MSPQRSPEPDEFYVGYDNVMPPATGRRLRRVLAAVAAGVALVAVVVVAAHDRLVPARFDFGRPADVAGDLRHDPYPWLLVDGERVWLAGPGKHDAAPFVAHVPGGPVTLRGSAIARGPHRMLQVEPGSVRRSGAPRPAASTNASTEPGVMVTLVGEVVDGKCFLGVMNPGEGTVHRECARLCLRGGLPPMLLVRGGLGEEALVVLVSSDGRPIGRSLAEIAGVPVEVRGRLVRERGALVLLADRAAYRLRDNWRPATD